MILACPGCDSRYDVTGHAIGQKFRCRCGEMMTLQAPPPAAGELACPHCGAGVAPGSSTCLHCSAELLVMACPRCLSRVFHGHKHCPHCGAELAIAATGDAEPDRLCPRCATGLHARRVGDIVIDECRACLGLFLDHVAIKRVVVDRAQSRAEALLGALPRREMAPVPPAQHMYVKCPVCRIVMNRRQFASGTGIVIDVCRAHGTFFDVGELPLIIELVMNGGLDTAQRKDIERAREAARRERDHAPVALPADYQDTGSLSGTGSALIDFLSQLFR